MNLILWCVFITEVKNVEYKKRSFGEDLSIKWRPILNKRQKVDLKYNDRGVVSKNVRSDMRVNSVGKKWILG